MGFNSLKNQFNDNRSTSICQEFTEKIILKRLFYKKLILKVESEFGSANRIVDSSGALFGNDSVKLGNITYGIVGYSEDNGKTKKYKLTNKLSASFIRGSVISIYVALSNLA